jgi:transcriptional regulator with XRE-family HTH domain
MRERHAITKEMARRYARAAKKQRGLMLDELCALTGYNRSYAARLLRAKARGPTPRRKRRRRGRGPLYGPELVAPLTKVWATLGGICGKRLAAVMGRTVAALERHGELELGDEARTQLLAMSAATIDRLLAAQRRRLRPAGMAHTKPGSLLKSQIPVRTFAEWDQGRAGFVEIDLVGHEVAIRAASSPTRSA